MSCFKFFANYLKIVNYYVESSKLLDGVDHGSPFFRYCRTLGQVQGTSLVLKKIFWGGRNLISEWNRPTFLFPSPCYAVKHSDNTHGKKTKPFPPSPGISRLKGHLAKRNLKSHKIKITQRVTMTFGPGLNARSPQSGPWSSAPESEVVWGIV